MTTALFADLPRNYNDLVRRYENVIRSVIYKLRVWPEEVEDMFQDVLTRMIENDIITRYHILNEEWVLEGKKPRPFKAYLITSVRNHVLNKMTSNNHNPVVSAESILWNGDSGSFERTDLPVTTENPLHDLIMEDTYKKVSATGIKFGSTIFKGMISGKTSREISSENKIPLKLVLKGRQLVLEVMAT